MKNFPRVQKVLLFKVDHVFNSNIFFDQPAPSMIDNQNNKTGGTQLVPLKKQAI